MSTPSPTDFRCPFLRNIGEAFLRRRKAISHSGKFEWESGEDDEGEWLSLWMMGHGRHPTLALHFWDGNLARLFIRSAGSADRGKVLLRIDDMVLVDDAPAIVAAFEHTRLLAHFFHEDGKPDEIRETWLGLTRAVDS